jgi:hypothetical protein
MYGLINHDVEGMALAGTSGNEVYGIPRASILPDIIKISVTDQECLANLDSRAKA